MQNIYCVVEVETRNAYCNEMPIVHAFTNLRRAEAFLDNRAGELTRLRGLTCALEDFRSKKNVMYRFTAGEEVVTLTLTTNMTGPSIIAAKATTK